MRATVETPCARVNVSRAGPFKLTLGVWVRVAESGFIGQVPRGQKPARSLRTTVVKVAAVHALRRVQDPPSAPNMYLH
jgi:hypothetical protein